MGRKRSKGVTFWAWAYILIHLFCLMYCLLTAEEGLKTQGTALFVVSLLPFIAYIVCGIFLLKLKEPARKAAICLAMSSIVFILIFLTAVLKDGGHNRTLQVIVEQVQPQRHQYELAAQNGKVEGLEKIYSWIAGIVLVPLLVYEMIPIWFFTRPKVKEQFNQKGIC